MVPTVYLVSGANRGIGVEIVKSLLGRGNTVVFAGTRDPGQATHLQALADQYSGRLHVVKLASANEVENRAAVKQIRDIAGRLDVVIANAGINKVPTLGVSVPLASMQEHFEVNTLGPLVLFQATYPLLKESTATPKFIPVSSVAGSLAIGGALQTHNFAYGVSKAALNFIARKLRVENDGLICFPLCPGPVSTDMLAYTLQHDEGVKGIEIEMLTPENVAPMLLKRIDEGTRETDEFARQDGTTWPW